MDATSVKSSMNQQIRVLNQIDELVKHCKDNVLIGDMAEEDLKALEDYTGTMRRACDAAIKLAETVQAAEKLAELSTAGKDDPEKKKKDTAKPAKEKQKKETTPENDDLDFLD